MKLSTRGRYGTRLIMELARNYGKGPVSVSAIAVKQEIAFKYLEQLIIPFKKAGFVTSIRGPKGGYMLTKSPDMIRLWDILTLLEDHLSIVDCISDETVCDNTSDCPIRPIWGKAFNAMMKVFKETSLADILYTEKPYQKS